MEYIKEEIFNCKIKVNREKLFTRNKQCFDKSTCMPLHKCKMASIYVSAYFYKFPAFSYGES